MNYVFQLVERRVAETKVRPVTRGSVKLESQLRGTLLPLTVTFIRFANACLKRIAEHPTTKRQRNCMYMYNHLYKLGESFSYNIDNVSS